MGGNRAELPMQLAIGCTQAINVAIIGTKINSALPSDGSQPNRTVGDEPPLLVAGLRGVRDYRVDVRESDKQRIPNCDRFIALIELQSGLSKGGLNGRQMTPPLKMQRGGNFFGRYICPSSVKSPHRPIVCFSLSDG